MHTLKVVAVGLMLLVIFAAVGRITAGARGMAAAAVVFAPVWIVCSGINMYLGARLARYSLIAGETRHISIELTDRSFAYWDLALKN